MKFLSGLVDLGFIKFELNLVESCSAIYFIATPTVDGYSINVIVTRKSRCILKFFSMVLVNAFTFLSFPS